MKLWEAERESMRIARFVLYIGMVVPALPTVGWSYPQQQNPPDTRQNQTGRGQEARGGRGQEARGGRGQSARGGTGQGNRAGVPQNARDTGQSGRAAPRQEGRAPLVQGTPLFVNPQNPAGAAQVARPGIQLPNRMRIVQPAQPAEPALMRMRLEDRNVTAEIRVTPLQQVLEELAARSGVVFEIDTQENPPMSFVFYRVSLEEAIQRLTADYNSIAFFDSTPAGQDHVSFVRIISRTLRPMPSSLRYIGTGAITKRGIDVIDSPEQALTVLTESPDVASREKAVESLVAFKSPEVLPALKVALLDSAAEVRVAAVEALAGLGMHEALPQVLPLLKDRHPGVRQSAVLAVSLLGDVANVKDLRPLLRDQDASVVAAADMAIRKLSLVRRP